MTMTAAVTLPGQVQEAFATSAMTGAIPMVSYTDANGTVRASYRGSTHVHSDTQLAVWIRNREGSLQRFVAGDAPVDVILRNARSQAFYRISGVARLIDDPAVADQVYRDSPPHEQAADPQRAGVAVVIDVQRVAGRDATGKVLVEAELFSTQTGV